MRRARSSRRPARRRRRASTYDTSARAPFGPTFAGRFRARAASSAWPACGRGRAAADGTRGAVRGERGLADDRLGGGGARLCTRHRRVPLPVQLWQRALDKQRCQGKDGCSPRRARGTAEDASISGIGATCGRPGCSTRTSGRSCDASAPSRRPDFLTSMVRACSACFPGREAAVCGLRANLEGSRLL